MAQQQKTVKNYNYNSACIFVQSTQVDYYKDIRQESGTGIHVAIAAFLQRNLSGHRLNQSPTVTQATVDDEKFTANTNGTTASHLLGKV